MGYLVQVFLSICDGGVDGRIYYNMPCQWNIIWSESCTVALLLLLIDFVDFLGVECTASAAI